MTQQPRPPARERLIESAGPIFARLGYEGATVTQICTEAGCNIAAINYHFGDKASLYREVVKSAIDQLSSARTSGRGDDPPAREGSLEEVLGELMRNTLTRVLKMSAGDWRFALTLREFLQPTLPPTDPLTGRYNVLSLDRPWVPLVAKATGLKPGDERLQWTIYCLLAPMLLLGIQTDAMARHVPALRSDRLDIEAFSRHAARQMVRGLVAAKKSPRSNRE